MQILSGMHYGTKQVLRAIPSPTLSFGIRAFNPMTFPITNLFLSPWCPDWIDFFSYSPTNPTRTTQCCICSLHPWSMETIREARVLCCDIRALIEEMQRKFDEMDPPALSAPLPPTHTPPNPTSSTPVTAIAPSPSATLLGCMHQPIQPKSLS